MTAKRRLEYTIAAGDDLESIQRYVEMEKQFVSGTLESRQYFESRELN